MHQIPDQEFYKPVFSPWLGYGEFASFFNQGNQATLVSPDRCWILFSLLRQAIHLEGDIWECGVYRGGTATMMARLIN
jgi:O-methyltransferase